MKIGIGADHKGFQLKTILIEFLKKSNHTVIDCGTTTEESTDYPEYAFKVAELVAKNEVEFGILICYSGIGMSIAANKVGGVRAALCLDEKMAELARKHNDANILCLSGGFTDKNKATEIVEKFINTGFDGNKVGGERHKRRIEKILDYERGKKICED